MKQTLPVTVIDQIRLWEMERNRLKFTAGNLYEQFIRLEDYLDVLNFAKQNNCLLWESQKKRILVVTKEGHELVRNHLKSKTAPIVS